MERKIMPTFKDLFFNLDFMFNTHNDKDAEHYFEDIHDTLKDFCDYLTDGATIDANPIDCHIENIIDINEVEISISIQYCYNRKDQEWDKATLYFSIEQYNHEYFITAINGSFDNRLSYFVENELYKFFK